MFELEDGEAARVAVLAESLGAPVRPEHLQEVALAWRLFAPHRHLVMSAQLGPEAEPAPVFHP